MYKKFVNYFREVKVELKKVVWPGKRQIVQSTVVVLVLISVVSFFLGLVDIFLASLVDMLIGG